jgi:dynein heavy chain
VFNFQRVLGSDMKIQNWNIAGLPRDSFSVENAIIVDMSRRYSFTRVYNSLNPAF